MKSKYEGIDERDIKCSCGEKDCAESGVSFEGNRMNFHFLEIIDVRSTRPFIHQKTKSMILDKDGASKMIKELTKIISDEN